jgi:toxin YoeB
MNKEEEKLYGIIYSRRADEDLLWFKKKSGNRAITDKIDELIEDLEKHPEMGRGKPEKLKHRKEETWSRRILGKHRMEYQINEDRLEVFIITFLGHYGDK